MSMFWYWFPNPVGPCGRWEEFTVNWSFPSPSGAVFWDKLYLIAGFLLLANLLFIWWALICPYSSIDNCSCEFWWFYIFYYKLAIPAGACVSYIGYWVIMARFRFLLFDFSALFLRNLDWSLKAELFWFWKKFLFSSELTFWLIDWCTLSIACLSMSLRLECDSFMVVIVFYRLLALAMPTLCGLLDSDWCGFRCFAFKLPNRLPLPLLPRALTLALASCCWARKLWYCSWLRELEICIFFYNFKIYIN